LADIISPNTVPIDLRLSILENIPPINSLEDIVPSDQELGFGRGADS
jgi:hypothetical protein